MFGISSRLFHQGIGNLLHPIGLAGAQHVEESMQLVATRGIAAYQLAAPTPPWPVFVGDSQPLERAIGIADVDRAPSAKNGTASEATFCSVIL